MLGDVQLERLDAHAPIRRGVLHALGRASDARREAHRERSWPGAFDHRDALAEPALEPRREPRAIVRHREHELARILDPIALVATELAHARARRRSRSCSSRSSPSPPTTQTCN